jgi:uncharacterized protein
MRPLGRIATLLLACFVAIVVAIWVFQERLLFLPPPVPVVQGRGAEKVEYLASDGQRLFGFACRPSTVNPAPNQSLILLLHGNGDLADSWMDWCAQVAKESGLIVFAPEYRGYGGLPGKPSVMSVVDDARTAVTHARSRFNVAPADIIYYGHSLGTGIATRLAAELGARAVLLEAPMTSIVDVGQYNFGAPISWILPLISRADLAPVRDVAQISAPVFVAYGARDDVIPISMPPAVFDAARNKGELLRVEAAGHADVALRGGVAYQAWLQRALERAGAFEER